MKKTFITLLALAGIAMGETLLPDLLKSDSTPNMNWLGYTAGTTIAGLTGKDTTALTIENVTKLFKDSALDEAGWHAQIGGNQNGGTAYGVDTEVDTNNTNASEVLLSANDTFRFFGRFNYSGEIVACSVAVSSLISADDEVVSSISLGFDMAAPTSGTILTLWAWDGTNATSLMGGATINSTTLGNDALSHKFTGTTTNNTVTVTGLELDKNQSIIVIWGNSSRGDANTVSGLTSSYTTATVPEPATATLSLLALAGLAARRRRH